ncbi:hypothetical protein [Mycobacterium sp. 236(2023)]|uniref:hypothetical protein n=1 Tax=Mycobacterium sp. 236(2023) TaxID=3038163 RepID=UPI002415966A|nr:hypothetical protein [Mycobacterium sp. 236(2023)]MDG4669464.1 hypothetical protein [Mycobacterium sp. 236(2023)]
MKATIVSPEELEANKIAAQERIVSICAEMTGHLVTARWEGDILFVFDEETGEVLLRNFFADKDVPMIGNNSKL